MKKIYRVALIGCGQMGAVHLENIYYKENVQISCVCDLNLQKAEIFKRKYNAQRITDDIDSCIKSKDVDIVICATYPSSHLDILRKCIDAGKHLVCEKPITTNLNDGREFVRLVKENPHIKVLVGHILRHNRTYQKAAEMIKGGAIGSPIIMRMSQNHHTMNWDRYLELIKQTSPIIDCGVHYLDVMQWFTGEKITEVNGIGQRTEEDVPEDKYNYGLITVKLSGGSIGFYEAGWANSMSSDNLKEFVGPKGRIRIIYREGRQTHQEEGDLIEYYKYPERTYEMINVVSNRKPTDVQFDRLISMIENGALAEPSIDDVLSSFEIALKADVLIRKGRIL